MNEHETPRQFCDRVPRELGLVDFNSFEARRHLEMRLTERDNAVRRALLAEIEAIAKSNDARNEDFAYLIRDAVDELSAKYTQPEVPQ